MADRYLGQRKAVFIGGILMALGQFALTQRELLTLGLGLIIVGNGFFKPNISTMVGARSIPKVTTGATAPTRSSTWGSTSGRSCLRWSAGRWARANGSAGPTASRPRESA